jgi:hypothetical protein
MRSACAVLLAVGLAVQAVAADYTFDGTISRRVLENYLARSITMLDLLTGKGDTDDTIRMLTTCGAKFAGRTIYVWGGEKRLPQRLAKGKKIAATIRARDPEMILQAALFEIVTRDVGQLSVPAWVFREFGMAPEDRTFRYEAMLGADWPLRDHWRRGSSVPDIRQQETKMWFYYLAVNYIRIGCEALHIGQVELVGRRDRTNAHWWDVLRRIRAHAAKHARRHLVLIDGHVPSGGLVYDGDKLLCDFHSFPLRIISVAGRPQEGILRVGFLDSIYGRSRGGVTPSGWRCEHLPYLVELDNWGRSGREGQPTKDAWIWGYDEICWFARQPESYRNTWLRYAWDWVRTHDPNGFFQMPGSRCLAAPASGKNWYFANRPSPAVPGGFNQEGTIKAIWDADRRAGGGRDGG